MGNLNLHRKKILEEAYTKGLENENGALHKRMHLKKNTINYALEKLQEEDYFSNTKYDIDLEALKIGKFAWVFLSISWEGFEHEKIIKKLLDLTQVVSIAVVTGKNDIAVKVFGPSINNISAFVLMMEKIFQGAITEVVVFFANKEYKRHYIPIKKRNYYKLNKTDCVVLYEKTNNPKVSLSEIAEKYNFHRNTVSNRWNKLWKEKVIVKEIPDMTQKGYDEIKMGLKAFILIKPMPGKGEKIISSLMKNKEIQDIFTTLSNEIIIIVRTENSQTLASIHKMLAREAGLIKKTNTSIFLTKHNKTSLSMNEIKGLVGKISGL
jgi:DNA-binding Lrp family transcriptional regulator